MYAETVGAVRYTFPDLKDLLAKASPPRSGDALAGVAAASAEERVAAQMALADLPLRALPRRAGRPLRERRGHPAHRGHPRRRRVRAGRRISPWASFREWLLSRRGRRRTCSRPLAPGVTPEMAAAVSQDHAEPGPRPRRRASAGSSPGSATRSGCRAGSRCGCSRTTRPTTRAASRAAILDGLLYGSGDAVIGINPATDSPATVDRAARAWSTTLIQRYEIPTQSLRPGPRDHHASRRSSRGAPVDLVFQSVAGTEAANAASASTSRCCRGARGGAVARTAARVGDNVMYFETGQGSALSAERAPRRRPADLRGARLRGGAPRSSRCWSTPSSASSAPSTSTTASRSSAPGWRTTSAASCWACRWAATSATPTTPRPTRTTWTPCSRCSARPACTYVMGVPGADDVMLNYQSTSFHDALYLRRGARPAARAGVRGVAAGHGRDGRGQPVAAGAGPGHAVGRGRGVGMTDDR